MSLLCIVNKKYQTVLLLVNSIIIALIYSYSNNGFLATEAYSQSDNTVQLSCFDIVLVLAVLDFSIELGDKESIGETLEESEIAPDLDFLF
jgi:hypothetical protein